MPNSGQDQITVTLPDGRDVTFQSSRWRREERLLIIDSQEDPPEGGKREILGIFIEWWGFRVTKGR